MSDPDVLVVGGGHNGLICAAYLARAGIETVVVEARATTGGCADTEADLGARFNICNCDHTIIRSVPVADELALTTHGLSYLEPTLSMTAAFHDGSSPWALHHDVEATLDSLSGTHPLQRDAYRKYAEDAVPVARLLLEAAAIRPSTRSLLSLGRRHAPAVRTMVRWSRQSTFDILANYFDDWHLIMPAVSQTSTVLGLRPTAPGTGLGAVFYAVRHAQNVGRPVGGSGALPAAVRRSFEAAGGTVRTGARVVAVLLGDGRARGVRLDGGEEITADNVVVATDPRVVFTEWLEGPPRAAAKVAQRWQAQPVVAGYQTKIDAVLRAAPRAGETAFSTISGDVLAPTMILSPSPDEQAEACRLLAEGRISPVPTILANIPSVLDAAMSPGGKSHVLSLEVMFTPYRHESGPSIEESVGRWFELWARHMEPGATRLIDRYRAMTPERYEREFGLPLGRPVTYFGTPLAMVLGRPRELTRYRTPIGGLYLSGAGTLPGAGVTGAPGRNAAAVVAEDLGCPLAA